MADETKPEKPKYTMTDGESTFTFKNDSELFATAQPLKFKVDEYDCPVCGVVKVYVSVTLGDPELDGMYCQKCYARWVNKNLPRITKRG